MAGISVAAWFGVVVVAMPRLGELQRGETIPWRAIAAQIGAMRTLRLALISRVLLHSCPADPGRFHRFPCSSPPSDTKTGAISPKRAALEHAPGGRSSRPPRPRPRCRLLSGRQP